jgi:hypothetical protein
MSTPIDPVCVIHGKKMSEHDCLYCCMCFVPMTPDQCNVRADGKKEDVCKKCAELEKEMAEFDLLLVAKPPAVGRWRKLWNEMTKWDLLEKQKQPRMSRWHIFLAGVLVGIVFTAAVFIGAARVTGFR